MSEFNAFSFNRIHFFLTEPYPCSYLPGESARSQVVVNHTKIDNALYSDLIEQGFRRNGSFVYKPECDHCRACISVRINIQNFLPTRSQRRTLKTHKNLIAIERPIKYYAEHFELFKKYQQKRHEKTTNKEDLLEQYSQFLLQSHVDTQLIEFRQLDEHGFANRLVMLSIIDKLHNGLSAVYTFFDPDLPGSYGVYNILWQINSAKRLRVPYLYLGYWVRDCEKMRYKLNFHSLEQLENRAWIPLKKSQ